MTLLRPQVSAAVSHNSRQKCLTSLGTAKV